MIDSSAGTDVLEVLETYYDTAPRADATAEQIGPFTLFLRTDPTRWHYYARPRLGLRPTETVVADDVRRVRKRQREFGAPETFEWVHETTPSLLAAAQATGLSVERCPLLMLSVHLPAPAPSGVTVEVVPADSPRLAEVLGAIQAGFSGTDDVRPVEGTARVDRRREMIRAGLISTVAAYDEHGAVVGGGSHGPRGTTTELAGISVLPRARRGGIGAAVTSALVADALRRGTTTVFLSAQDDTVARIYERVGFVRVATACVAAPEDDTGA